jgi:hypothetical protein
MKTVRSLGAPPQGAHWSMGPDHMCQIGKADAMRVLGSPQLPAMGREILAKHNATTRCQLYLGNYSGSFYLSCASSPILMWPELFEVTVLPPHEVTR